MIRSLIWLMDGTTDGEVREGLVTPPAGGWVWVDVGGESEEAIRRVCGTLGVEESFVDEALEAGSLPMLEERKNLVYVVLNAFGAGADGRLRSSEVDLFLGPDYLISLHDDELTSADTIMERLRDGVSPVSTPAGLLAHLAMVGSRRYPGLIDALEGQVEGLEELAMKGDPRTITEVHALRRDVIVMRRVLVPQRQIYEELAEGGHPLIDAASRRDFDRVTDYQTQILEALEAARSLLGSVLETHRGAVADQTNEIVRVLTVFSAIMLPLALVTGIYGMNFIELPLADHPYGFWIMIGLIVVIGVALWLYFGTRGFVGAPRLSELPKAVGVGLYQVGSLPIRAVAEGLESLVARNGEDRGEGEEEPSDSGQKP